MIMTTTTKTIININDITFDRDLQFRTFTDAVHIEDLKSVYEEDGKFRDLPEIMRLVEGDATSYFIKDGTHRILAVKSLGDENIEVLMEDVQSREEAMFKAMGVNTQHGKQATVDDLKLAIRAISESPTADDYKKTPFSWDKAKLRTVLKCSSAKLARAMADTTAEMKLDMRLKIEGLYKQGKSLREIAAELGLSASTVQGQINTIKEEQDEVYETQQMLKTVHPEDAPWGTEGEVSQTQQMLKMGQSEDQSNGITSLTSDDDESFDDYLTLSLDEEDYEDDDVSNIDDLVSGFNRTEELKVVKPNATPLVDLKLWAAMYESMTAEQQVEALKAIGAIK